MTISRLVGLFRQIRFLGRRNIRKHDRDRVRVFPPHEHQVLLDFLAALVFVEAPDREDAALLILLLILIGKPAERGREITQGNSRIDRAVQLVIGLRVDVNGEASSRQFAEEDARVA
jgi:hypothetical protein